MMSGEDPPLGITAGMVRKLAAILSADVEGYSRLMGEDEAATIQILTTYRAVIEALVQQHRGRVVDSPGDNLLAEFASVVDAAQCGVAIQRELKIRNTPVPLHRRMNFRLGINLGDVIVDGERIYGDGVNIAARLESLADGGGICIAGNVYEQIKTKLALVYEDMGPQAVKNIADPVRVYRILTEPGTRVPPASQPKPRAATFWRRGLAAVLLLVLLGAGLSVWRLVSRPLPSSSDKPSIAVLPFANMSGDPEQEYFSDGITEDLTTELSRLTGLFVIARNSAFTYKGKEIKSDQVSRELGVRYLVGGSVRKANNQIRITAQLVDANTGYQMWAQYYDRDLQDIFAVQNEIARRITRALEVRLTKEEEKHMGRPYTSSQVAWEYFMRGAELYRRFTAKDNAKARELFEKAIDLDPAFARAYASLAATHRQDGSLMWTQDPETSEELAYRLAEKAVEIARRESPPQPSLPFALEQWAYVLLYRKQYPEATRAADEAVRLNPNYADGYAVGAHVLIYSGRPAEALRRTQEAIDHNPKYPFFYDYHRGQAYWVLGFQTLARDRNASMEHFRDAEVHLREALKKNKNFRPARAYLVAVLSELGQREEAVKEMAILRDSGRPQAFQDLKRFQEYVKQVAAYSDPAITARLSELWQRAESRP
jgi:adenylate cyclase